MIRRACLALLLAAWPALAAAEPPRVVTDIAPVHSLVARVMAGVGAPAQVLPPGASPHGHALRPSEAALLAEAEVLIWMGPLLTPWLERAIATLGAGAEQLALLEAEGTVRLPLGESGSHGDGHGHGDVDPHAWLDPRNAHAWLDVIAEALARRDPANTEVYRRNAAQGRAEIETLIGGIEARLAPVRGRPFVVFHDGYRYFERRFGVASAGALAPSDGAPPGPARIAAIRALIAREGVPCLFTEPQFEPALARTVVEGTGARIAPLDPLGDALPPGPGLYPALLAGLAEALAGCLE